MKLGYDRLRRLKSTLFVDGIRAYRFGQIYAERYPEFTRQGIDDGIQHPFVRSSGSPRVVESGGYIINVSPPLLGIGSGSHEYDCHHRQYEGNLSLFSTKIRCLSLM